MENAKRSSNEFEYTTDEQKHFNRIVHSFKAYDTQSAKQIAKSLTYYRSLPDRHRELLHDFEDNCRLVLECFDKNYTVIKLILEDVEGMFQNSTKKSKKEIDDLIDEKSLAYDVDRVNVALKQIVRDWSELGESERDSCYTVITSELKSLYPHIESGINVLVPGAGLGRLAYDIACMGFSCEGNEFSLHMLMTSNFILNKCYEANQYTVYPYAYKSSNNLTIHDRIKPVKFPDISPFEFTNEDFQFSMAAGDFLDIYQEKNHWNNVVTCFFIDTAHNIIDYMEKIWDILKPGGYWLNFGPLLYHYSDMPNENSLDLTYEQIKRIIQKIGFKYLKENLDMKSQYIGNEKSMLQYNYNAVFFVVQKPSD